MNEFLNYQTLRSYAYSNDKLVKSTARGLVIQFHGCNDTDTFDDDLKGAVLDKNKTHAQKWGEFYAEKGIFYLIPYSTPWNWLYNGTVEFIDDLVSVLLSEYNLNNLPIALSGISMGGQGALSYCYLSMHKSNIVSCATNCPVCDLVEHFKTSNLTRRTILTTFYTRNNILEKLENYSPIHNIDKLPKIKYYLFQCERDVFVDKKINAEAFVKKMKEQGFDVTYHLVANRPHLMLPKETYDLYASYIVDSLIK